MLSFRRIHGKAMDATGSSDKDSVEVPEDLSFLIAAGKFKNRAARLATKVTRDKYPRIGFRIDELHRRNGGSTRTIVPEGRQRFI